MFAALSTPASVRTRNSTGTNAPANPDYLDYGVKDYASIPSGPGDNLDKVRASLLHCLPHLHLHIHIHLHPTSHTPNS